MKASFQSTPPVKAATYYYWRFLPDTGISIHAAREGGDYTTFVQSAKADPISIHAAREGGDCYAAISQHKCGISIHAAREGGDSVRVFAALNVTNFNPRRP